LSCAPYVPSSPEVVNKMLELGKITTNDVVYDLGCGDGRILIATVKDFFAKRAVGYEINQSLFKTALNNIKKSNLFDRIELFNEDLFKADLSKANVVTLYLTSWANEKLKPKIENETKSGTRIISHDFEVHGWKPRLEERFNGHALYVYEII